MTVMVMTEQTERLRALSPVELLEEIAAMLRELREVIYMPDSPGAEARLRAFVVRKHQVLAEIERRTLLERESAPQLDLPPPVEVPC